MCQTTCAKSRNGIEIQYMKASQGFFLCMYVFIINLSNAAYYFE